MCEIDYHKICLRPLFLCICLIQTISIYAQTEKIRLAVAGMSHGHVGWILNEMERSDVEVVGIYEEDEELIDRYIKRYGFSRSLVYSSLHELIQETEPEAVAAFGPTYDHLKVVQACAPEGIDVMVEKPLAVSMDHARQMADLAQEHGIHIITNYETSWYLTNEKAKQMVDDGVIGPLRKVVVNDGHEGPKEIGVGPEFLRWLVDPVLNGGGAVADFGCYGANLMTWLTKGQRPSFVYGVLQTIKKDIYPNVDDEATIVLEYPEMQGIIQASWNWPVGRKDMEVYGQKGQIFSIDRHHLTYKLTGEQEPKNMTVGDRDYPFDDPFSLFAAVVRGTIQLPPYDPYTLENNLIVIEILDAARESDRTGMRISLSN